MIRRLDFIYSAGILSLERGFENLDGSADAQVAGTGDQSILCEQDVFRELSVAGESSERFDADFRRARVNKDGGATSTGLNDRELNGADL